MLQFKKLQPFLLSCVALCCLFFTSKMNFSSSTANDPSCWFLTRCSTPQGFTYQIHIVCLFFLLFFPRANSSLIVIFFRLLIGHRYLFTQKVNVTLRKSNPLIFLGRFLLSFCTMNKSINQSQWLCSSYNNNNLTISDNKTLPWVNLSGRCSVFSHEVPQTVPPTSILLFQLLMRRWNSSSVTLLCKKEVHPKPTLLFFFFWKTFLPGVSW